MVENEDDIRSAMGDNVGDEIFGAANIIQAAGAEPIEPQSFGDSHSVFSSGATSNGDNDISDAMSMISLGSDASKVSLDQNLHYFITKIFEIFRYLTLPSIHLQCSVDLDYLHDYE